MNAASALVRYERHLVRLPRFEAHGRAGGNVEPEPACLRAIEVKRRVRFGKVVVRPDLDRPVALIADCQAECLASGVALDFALWGEEVGRASGRERGCLYG